MSHWLSLMQQWKRQLKFNKLLEMMRNLMNIWTTIYSISYKLWMNSIWATREKLKLYLMMIIIINGLNNILLRWTINLEWEKRIIVVKIMNFQMPKQYNKTNLTPQSTFLKKSHLVKFQEHPIGNAINLVFPYGIPQNIKMCTIRII